MMGVEGIHKQSRQVTGSDRATPEGAKTETYYRETGKDQNYDNRGGGDPSVDVATSDITFDNPCHDIQNETPMEEEHTSRTR